MEIPLDGSLPSALRDVARSLPDTLVAFPEIGVRTTVKEVVDRADRLASVLRGVGVDRGDVVGLLVSTGPQNIIGVAGVTASGAAVSIMPSQPVMRDPDAVARSMTNMIDAAEMRVLLIGESQREFAVRLRKLRPALRVLDVSALDLSTRTAITALPEVGADDIAVIQYTSGSTSRPKGVQLTHRSVLAGLRSIVASARITTDDVFIHWVPQFHDMGLFGWLATMLAGVPTHTFSPLGFIRRPGDFLRYFAEHRGTITTGPNFGYDLLIRAADPELLGELDLSRWRLAFNGAEPVSASTVSAFAERFAPGGVRPGVMYPVYGMAEATLAVTFPAPGDPPRIHYVDRALLTNNGEVRTVDASSAEAKALVSVGRPVSGLDVRLIDESGAQVPEETLGEIEIRGSAVTSGYRGDPAATEAAFRGGWFRTGDLGYLHDGELFVAGRSKEMIIVNGQNFFPDDVEAVVRDLPGVYRNRCVAFSASVPDRDEYLMVVVEAKRGTGPELAEEIRAAVGAGLGLTAVQVHVTPPGSLPRTTSGKWQRGLVKKLVGQPT